ncbi:heat shock protein [Pseudomonas aeruginosa]|nr:heat shock protein [Pseudomonas aeruginosa]
MPVSEKDDDKVRLDKWLWAARFFKTRALAKAAIEGGKVHCRGERCKPSKEPRVGEELTIRTGFDERTVTIRALSVVRRGAPEAQALYEETADSVESRERAAAMRKAGALGVQTEGGRARSSGGRSTSCAAARTEKRRSPAGETGMASGRVADHAEAADQRQFRQQAEQRFGHLHQPAAGLRRQRCVAAPGEASRAICRPPM